MRVGAHPKAESASARIGPLPPAFICWDTNSRLQLFPEASMMRPAKAAMVSITVYDEAECLVSTGLIISSVNPSKPTRKEMNEKVIYLG